MKLKNLLMVTCSALFLWTPPLFGEDNVAFEENFTSLDNWKPFTFKNIETPSHYTLVEEDGRPCLLMETHGGASALLSRATFNVYQYPRLTWRWKVSNVYQKGDSSSKDGDDYPARLYIMFRYDKEQASFTKQMQYEVVKMIYGQYPPDSSLNYIWANRPEASGILTNVYTDKTKMIPVAAGTGQLGQWVEYSVNIVEDYKQAFQKKPPAQAAIAVMIDSDNTGESAHAYIDFIRLSR